MATWNANYELTPASLDTVGQGDNAIIDLKSAISTRMGNDHTTYLADGTAGAATKDWLHKGGSAVGLLQNATPAARNGGEALGATARDKGFIWFDDDNEDCIYLWLGAAFGTPGLILTNKSGADPTSPVTGQMWLRTDV
jgi:hypothetical protein